MSILINFNPEVGNSYTLRLFSVVSTQQFIYSWQDLALLPQARRLLLKFSVIPENH